MSEILEKVLKDKSLYGKLHNIHYHALMLKVASGNETELYNLLDTIQDKGYRASSLINSLPGELGKMVHDQDLKGYLEQIEEALSSIEAMGYDLPEIEIIKENLVKAKAIALVNIAAIV